MVFRNVKNETHLQELYQARIANNKELDVALSPGTVRLWTLATKKLVNVSMRGRVCRQFVGKHRLISTTRLQGESAKSTTCSCIPSACPMKAG